MALFSSLVSSFLTVTSMLYVWLVFSFFFGSFHFPEKVERTKELIGNCFFHSGNAHGVEKRDRISTEASVATKKQSHKVSTDTTRSLSPKQTADARKKRNGVRSIRFTALITLFALALCLSLAFAALINVSQKSNDSEITPPLLYAITFPGAVGVWGVHWLFISRLKHVFISTDLEISRALMHALYAWVAITLMVAAIGVAIWSPHMDDWQLYVVLTVFAIASVSHLSLSLYVIYEFVARLNVILSMRMKNCIDRVMSGTGRKTVERMSNRFSGDFEIRTDSVVDKHIAKSGLYDDKVLRLMLRLTLLRIITVSSALLCVLLMTTLLAVDISDIVRESELMLCMVSIDFVVNTTCIALTFPGFRMCQCLEYDTLCLRCEGCVLYRYSESLKICAAEMLVSEVLKKSLAIPE